MSIVEVKRMSVLQYTNSLGFGIVPVFTTPVHGLQHVYAHFTHHTGTQGPLQNQDAVCAAGAMVPLLDIIAAGPDQLAAKSAARAISALATNHTANQDAFRLSYSNLTQRAPPGMWSSDSACVLTSAHKHASL